MKLSPSQQEVKDLLDKGKTFSQYPTGDNYGYNSMLRWDHNLEVINSKTIVAMQRKGLVGDWEIKTQIVK